MIMWYVTRNKAKNYFDIFRLFFQHVPDKYFLIFCITPFNYIKIIVNIITYFFFLVVKKKN